MKQTTEQKLPQKPNDKALMPVKPIEKGESRSENPVDRETLPAEVYESHGTAEPEDAPEGNAWELDTKPDEDRDLVIEPPMRNTRK